jgi:hypothetical protein
MESDSGRERMDDGRRRCVATASSTGERCRKAPVRGATVCATHGGSVGRVRAAAARRVAESAALAVYERHSPNGDTPVDVGGALLELAAEVRRFTAWAGRRVETLTAADWRPDEPRAAAELALYERALDRSGRLLADLSRLKLEARLVRITELQVAALSRIVERTLRDHGVDPRDESVRRSVARYARLESGHG